MPAWIRIVLLAAASVWMIGWIIVVGRLMIKFVQELMIENDIDNRRESHHE